MRSRHMLLACCLALGAGAARAEEIKVIPVQIHNNVFIPAEIHVPAAKPVFLEITNADATPEEFDSGILGIEKVIPAGGKARVRLHPLAPGRYPFMGEFHPQTATGAVVADPPN